MDQPQTTPAAQSQASQLIAAMSFAFIQTNKGFENPDPMEGAAALVHLQAQFLSNIRDRKVRKQYRAFMEGRLSHELATLLAAMEREDASPLSTKGEGDE